MSTPSIDVAQAILKRHLRGMQMNIGLSAPDDSRPAEELPIHHPNTPGFTTAQQVAECADQKGGITVFLDGSILFIADEGAEHVPYSSGQARVLTKAQPTFIPGHKQFA